MAVRGVGVRAVIVFLFWVGGCVALLHAGTVTTFEGVGAKSLACAVVGCVLINAGARLEWSGR